MKVKATAGAWAKESVLESAWVLETASASGRESAAALVVASGKESVWVSASGAESAKV